MEATLLFNIEPSLGEGAIWNTHDKKLYWVDILSGNLHAYDPLTGEKSCYPTNRFLGAAVPINKGNMLLALNDGIVTINLQNGEIKYNVKTSLHIEGKRFNDGKCDPLGRFWVGTLTLGKETNDNNLYCIGSDFSMSEKVSGLTISNGIAWALNGSAVYHIDTPTGEVTKHDFDINTGAVSNRQTIIKIPHAMGYPDGMTIDNEGMLWIALWDGFCVARYNPNTGDLLQKIKVPAPKVTSCAFGGENLDQLYITTARCDMSTDELEEHPFSGGLFVADVKIKGVEAYSFSSF